MTVLFGLAAAAILTRRRAFVSEGG